MPPSVCVKVHRKYASMRSRGREQALGVVMVVCRMSNVCAHMKHLKIINISRTRVRDMAQQHSTHCHSIPVGVAHVRSSVRLTIHAHMGHAKQNSTGSTHNWFVAD